MVLGPAGRKRDLTLGGGRGFPAAPAPQQGESAVRRSSPSFTPVALASLTAGPVFFVSTALAATYLQLPRPVIVDPAAIVALIVMLVPLILVGFFLSIMPNLIGSSLLLVVGAAIPAARARPVWIATGALSGAAIAGLTDMLAEPAYAFGLILTSASCAAICRLSACWD